MKTIPYNLTGNSIICANPKANIVDTSIVVNGKSVSLTPLEGMLFILVASTGMMPKNIIEPILMQHINQAAKANKGFGDTTKAQLPSVELLLSRLKSYDAIVEIDWDSDESVLQVLELYAKMRMIPAFKNPRSQMRTIRSARRLSIESGDVSKYIKSSGGDSAKAVVDWFKVNAFGYYSTLSMQGFGLANGISAVQIARLIIMLHLDGHLVFSDARIGGAEDEAGR